MLSWWWLAAGCAGGGDGALPPPEPPPSASVVPAELLAQTWQVRLAPAAARAPFEGRESWMAYLAGRRTDALVGFRSEGDTVALGRAHLEMAAAYALATQLAARATVQVYGQTPTEGDPVEVSTLLGVSGVLLGLPELRARLGSAPAGSPMAEVDAAWKGVAGRPDAPPWRPADVAGLPPTPGELPTAGAVPHFQLAETLPGGLVVPAEDPGTSWALMDWHRRTALVAAPELAPAAPYLLLPWAGPDVPEATVAPKTLPDAAVFLSLGTTAADLLYFGSVPAVGDVDQMRQFGTPEGMIAASCRAQPDFAECVLDEAQRFGAAIQAAMALPEGPQPFHRAFADRGRVGAIVYAAQVAELLAGGAECPEQADAAGVPVVDPGCAATAAEAWRVPTGRLRVAALDQADASGLADPVLLLWVAAWDAGNRNTVRATELVHRAEAQVPGLDAARVPLDALHLRVSRNAAPSVPTH